MDPVCKGRALENLEMHRLSRNLDFIGHRAVLMIKLNSCKDEDGRARYQRSLERCVEAHRKCIQRIDTKIAFLRPK